MAKTAQQRLDDLLAKLRPDLRKAFLEAMARQATAVNVNDLVDALDYAARTGDYGRVDALLQLNRAMTQPMVEVLRAAYIAGGQTVGQTIPLALRATFGFGGNPRALADIDRITGDLITNIETGQRQAVIATTRELIGRVVNEGIPVRRAALEIVGTINRATGLREGGYLGLDVPRAEQAARVAAMLRDPELIKDYFISGKARYTTTDRRFDARVRKAIAEGRALTTTEADPITKAHRARLMKNRADTISRNEGLNALRAGERAGFQQLVDSGTVDDSRIIREWLPTKDARTRDDHVAMTGQTRIGMAAAFTFPDGSMAMYPGDSSLGAPANMTVQCRCSQSWRLKRPGAA